MANIMRLEIRGEGDFLRLITGVGRRTKEVSSTLTRDMASALRRRVKDRIPPLKSPLSSGHSTPTPMLQRLASVRKAARGHTVGFITKSEDEEHNLPAILEYGAKPHTIAPRRRQFMGGEFKSGGRFSTRGAVNHPGIPATHFWSKAIEDFLEKDFRGTVDEKIRKIVGRN
tara:strand:+ start:1231 stop:1743 length:513 start_codon:yes stop_codon:yes gene_type:complete